jgi:membrane protein implicated in regulation of membrane protease activity
MITFPKFILIWIIVLAAIAICLLFPPASLVVPVGATYLLQMIIEKVFEKAISVEENRGKKDDTLESDETEDD